MAHDPTTLAYADYFAAAARGGVATATLLDQDHQVDDAGEQGEEGYQLQYGHVQHGLGVFGAVRGLGLMPAGDAAAHGNKAALADFAGVLAEQQHHQHRHAPALTSLSLHGGPADAATLALHQHQAAAWTQQQHPQAQQGAWHLRGSRFLRPAQQLLQEFCSLPVEAETATTTNGAAAANSRPPPAKPASEDGDSVGGGGGSSSSAPLSAQIQAMDAAELQRLKAKLYAMLQEVLDRPPFQFINLQASIH